MPKGNRGDIYSPILLVKNGIMGTKPFVAGEIGKNCMERGFQKKNL